MSYPRDATDWCYTCERFHGPMDYGDGCYTALDAEDREKAPLPWARPFAWLRGGRCRARLSSDGGALLGRWGRCELARGHDHPVGRHPEAHALEYGAQVVRWRGDGVCRDRLRPRLELDPAHGGTR